MECSKVSTLDLPLPNEWSGPQRPRSLCIKNANYRVPIGLSQCFSKQSFSRMNPMSELFNTGTLKSKNCNINQARVGAYAFISYARNHTLSSEYVKCILLT